MTSQRRSFELVNKSTKIQILKYVRNISLHLLIFLLVNEVGAGPHLVHGEHRGVLPHEQVQVLAGFVHLVNECFIDIIHHHDDIIMTQPWSRTCPPAP